MKIKSLQIDSDDANYESRESGAGVQSPRRQSFLTDIRSWGWWDVRRGQKTHLEENGEEESPNGGGI